MLTEAGAVRFERLNQPNQFRTVLPDGTEIETPLPAPDDPAALPHEAGYVPAGYNNLGSRPLPLCPCVNALAAAAPLNPVNGNFHYAVADVTVPSHGLPLTFTRYYNSQYRRSSPAYLAAQPGLGAGWRHTYQIELDITDAPLERVTLWLADGARHRFVAIAPGSARYRSTTLLSLTLERQGGLLGTWQAFAADGTVYTFDRAGRLERISAAPGGSLALSPLPQDYGPGGWLVVDAYGRRLEIYTDAGGRIVRLRDSLLRDFTYEYDASGSYLTGVRYISPALTASYQYNDDDRLIALDDVRSPLTQRVSLSYDGRGRIQQALTGAAADGSGALATDYSYAAGQTEQRVTVSGAVRVTTWRYDERFLLTETISPRREVSTGFVYDAVSGLPVSYRTATRASYQFQFDAPGNLIRLNDPFLTGINDGFLFTYTQRDTLSLLTQLEYPGEVVEQFTYGEAPAGQRPLLLSRRRLVQATPARRWAETRYEYDERGRVVLLVEPGIDDSDTATVFVYDTAGYPAEIWQGIAIAPEETRLNLTPERALRRLRLTYDLTGRLRALQDGTGSLYTLTYDSATDRLIAITLPEGVRLAYTYDARGNLLTVEERGQVLRYRYDTFDRLIEIRTPEDHTTRYTYDEAGNVLTETDALGRVFRYAYDALNQPVQHIAPDGAITTYETVYDTTASRIERREVLPSGRSLVRRLDALGRLRQMTITEAGFQQEYLLDYSVNGYPTLIKENFSGRTITLAYDLSGQLLTASIAGLTTRYDYDRAGHLVQVTGAGGQRTTYTYDRLGNVTGSTLPDGSRLSYAYDAAGNVTEATDAAGQTTRYTYDALHQLRRQLAPDGSSTDYRYDSRGNLTEIVDALGQTRTFTYDLFDRLTGAVDASGEETLYTYDAIGRLTAVAQPAGRSVRYGYDLAGNLIATTLSPLQRRTLYSYDAAGRLTGVTNPLGQTLAYAYNGFGRLSSASDPVGNTQQFEWRSGTLSPAGYLSTGGLRLRFLSDDFGRLTDIRDAASDSTQGRVARLTYDDDGFITAIITGTGSVPDSQAWRYTYDAAGRILSVTEPAGGVWVLAYDAAGQVASLTDPGGSITRYERDAAGRITRRLRQAGTAAETGESFAYDAGGNLIAYTGPGGTVHRYTYDASHRLTEAVLAAGTPAAQTYRFEYNGQGQVTLLQLPSGLTTRYIYSLDNIARAEMQAGETSIIYRYEYDEAGNLIRLVLPDVDGEPAAIITLSYDAPGRLVRYADSTGSVRAYTYDSAGNLSQISDPTGSTGRYEYDLYRRVTRLLLPGDTEVRLSYNPDGYPASVTLPPGAEGARQTIQYTVDEAGRVTAIRQGDTLLRQFTYDARGQLIARQDAAGVLTCYSYDSAGHVVAAVYRQRGSACDGDPADIRATLGYTYDAAGNRLTVTRDNNPAAAFRYDALNRPVSVQRGDLALTYTYDAAGNVQSRAAGPYGSARYTYDAFQRLIRIDYGTDSLTLSYDARSNLREIARSNGVRSLYNYDAAGRIVRILHVNAADERLDGFNYRYDAEGNLIVVDRVTDNWRILYSYDVAHRLIGERWLNENGETVYTLAVRYDAAGNRLEVIRNGR
ncbi:MAG: DUF6531 domain-containing protein, partial [Anaerolineae bacterium]|nr:DUF6531 domain-containing protein [Anaerolineae bacterium]